MAEPNEDDPPRDRPWDRGGRRDRDDDDDDRPRRRRRDDDDDDRPPRSAANGLATAGLILGLLALCTTCLTGVPAIICSAIALGKPGGRGAATAGLILGAVGTLAGIGLGIWGMTEGRQRVQFAAMRMTDANNLKQIAVGFHAHDDTFRGISAYALDNFGRPNTDLSWRVSLLPFLEQGNLYRKYDLSQPWDSPQNKALSNTPLKVFTSPFDGPEPSVNTPYRVFVGGGALFDEDGRPISLRAVPDGTSNTILAIHAAEQVWWAEPRELVYSPNGPLPKLGHPSYPKGFTVAMADGSVRFVDAKVSEKTLRAAITRAGGEALGSDW